MNRARVIFLNDVGIGDAVAAKLVTFVEGGGGLMMSLGPRASWPSSRAAWLPVSIGPPVDRTRGAAARLSGIEFGHAIFEPFRAPRSGDFSTARFYSYRALSAAKDASVLARFDTGEPALVERNAGRGRVLVFGSTLDLSWNDLALKPMFLPLVHQIGRHLSGFKEQPAWLTIGQVLDIDAAEIAAGATSGNAARAAAGRAILTPSGQRRDLPAPVAATPGGTAPAVAALELTEQGFYEVRGSGREAGPVIVAASNVSLAESNLDRIDPKELVAAVTGTGRQARRRARTSYLMQRRTRTTGLVVSVVRRYPAPDRRNRTGASLFARSHVRANVPWDAWNPWNNWNRENPQMGEVNARAQLLEVVRQVRRRWRIKLALRGAVGFLVAGVLAIIAMAYALEWLKFTPTAIFSFRIVTALVLVAAGAWFFARPLSRKVTDAQVALYLEEHEPTLDSTILIAMERPSGPATGRRG